MIRVGQVVPSLDDPNAGPSYSVTYLARVLSADGWDCPVFCVGTPAAGLPEAVIRSFEADRNGWLGKRLRGASAMLNALRSSDCSLLHAHSLWLLPSHYAARAAIEGKLPLVISPRGMLSEWAMSHHKWRKRVVWHWWQRCDLLGAAALHVTSDQEAEDSRRAGFRGPLALIPNGVTVPSLTGLERKRRVVFLSRLHKKKGLDLLIDAWSRVEPLRPEWSLAIAGPDEDGSGAAASEQAHTLGCQRVDFVGPLHGAAKARFLEEAALFVLPTHSENFGIAIAEAMAHGLPVITTTGTPWNELPKRNAGWWIELSRENLTAVLLQATELPAGTLAEMGQDARRWMESDYSWEYVGSQMKALYLWLLGKGSRPSFIL
ncbi:MAG: glycosyltransferase [Polyangiaceae bacterium]